MNRISLAAAACFAALALTPPANAEIPVVEHDGWTIGIDGRVGAFASYTFGEGLPLPECTGTLEPNPVDGEPPVCVGGVQQDPRFAGAGLEEDPTNDGEI
jgi:hypothetical protein